MTELWKDVEGYEGLYRVSSFGRVMGFAWKQEWTLIKTYYCNRGYLYIALTKEGIQKKYKIHRLVGTAFIPNPENKPQIDHINRNKLDNRIENLRWVSCSENCINRTGIGNTSGEKHIYYRQSKNRYEVIFHRKSGRIFECFKTLPEAIQYRDAYLVENKI